MITTVKRSYFDPRYQKEVQVELEIVIDVAKIADQLGYKAYRNNSGIARAVFGGVIVKAVQRPVS